MIKYTILLLTMLSLTACPDGRSISVSVEAINGKDGKDGQDGQDGKDGLSAYELAQLNGFVGSLEEWLESLIGERGEDGLSALELTEFETVEDLLASLKGDTGEAGQDGANGLSAYEIAVINGFEGTSEEFIASLVGPMGPQGAVGPPGPPGEAAISTGSSALPVQLCHNDSGSHKEYGLIIDGELYAVYHQVLYNGNGNARVVIGSNTFWAKLAPGATYVTTNGASCQFTYTKSGNTLTLTSGNVVRNFSAQ